MNVENLIKNNILKIHPVNINKKIEAENCNIFYPITNNNKIIKSMLYFDNKINKNIIKEYEKKPDILIIIFNKNKKNMLELNSIPIYPIFYKNIFYLTPILIEQLNGFSNIYSDNISSLNDFLNRIYYQIGCIVTDNLFKINITNHDISGIKDFRNDFLKDFNVSNCESWMTKYIPECDFGWFGLKNRLFIKYVFDNYDIKNIAELGIYMGKSTKYISNLNKNTNLYCFDRFDNLFLTDYSVKNLDIPDTNFFFKYMRFETFFSNLKNHKNLYAIKNDNFLSIKWLVKNNIKIDLFYIDFIKQEHALIDFVNEIFESYPNSIIIGDDVVHLNYSLLYFKKKYKFYQSDMCYICMKDRNFINKDILIKDLNNLEKNFNIKNINDIINLDKVFYYYFIINKINEKKDYKQIIDYIKIMNINPNYIIDENNNNIYHYLIKVYKKININYYINLYNELIKKYPDEHKKNDSNITPLEYKLFTNYFDL